MLVEPWMPMRKIDSAVSTAKPVAYVANWLGRLWGARVPSIRAIGRWLSAASLERTATREEFHIEAVAPESTGVLTFTSGTTGTPKGVIRSHEYLVWQHEVLCHSLGLDQFSGGDLCIFANFVLANLASGRTSVLIPPPWRRSHLEQLDGLPENLRPETLTCGPGFLRKLMRAANVASLRSIHVGGALTDCAILESGFERWPDAHWLSVYGSTEAEPVATCNARVAVQKSRGEGYFQTLFLGTPVAEIDSDLQQDGLWVAGAHVCPKYLGNVEENRIHKRRDAEGRVWHFMGDRIRTGNSGDNGWWYAGRSSQLPSDFELEQEACSLLQSSKAFIHRRSGGEPVLVGENVKSVSLAGVESYVEARIYRDSRHHARIDRQKTLRKGARWLLG
jgi:acyl-coenzyme A synthetase/AMP-(fatty) acid ligase